MPSIEKITTKLRELDPRSRDFYVMAAGYYREHARAHRNYGRFFIGFGLLSWAGVFSAPGPSMVGMLLFNFCFTSFVGWTVLIGARRIAHALAQANADSDAETRLESLRTVALMQRYDAVSLLILEQAGKETRST